MKGALIFAFNNESIDYIKLAAWSAKNIRRHLDIPVAVVTDSTRAEEFEFDKIIYTQPKGNSNRHFVDINGSVTWFNGNRIDAYSLTPWNHTLLLDADYIVASSTLNTLFDINSDILCHRLAYDLTGLNSFDSLNHFGRYHMPMYWATVISFKKSAFAQLVFDMMQMIHNNWQHYCNIYNEPNRNYRNDYALSIALNTLYGHCQQGIETIPWNLASLTPEHKLILLGTDEYRVDFLNQQQQSKYIIIKDHDFHAMGKQHLGDIIGDRI